MATEEPVTSPDQHKPGHPRPARIGAVLVILILIAMIFSSQRSWTANLFLIGTAALIAGILVADWLLRKNGLRS